MLIIEVVLVCKLVVEKVVEIKVVKKVFKVKVYKYIKVNFCGKDVDIIFFLIEGDLVIGYFIDVCDKEFYGGYLLCGKVFNSWGMFYVDMFKNKELFDICVIIGLVFGEKVFEEKEDGEWFIFELNGDIIIVNENDEV